MPYDINHPEFPAYFSRVQEAWAVADIDTVLHCLSTLLGPRSFPGEDAPVNVGEAPLEGQVTVDDLLEEE